MDGDPYARILGIVRGETKEQTPAGETSRAGLGAGPCKLRLGKVKQPVPLKLTVAGVEQPTEVLFLNERLTQGARWKTRITSPESGYNGLTGSLSGPVSCPGGQGSPSGMTVTGGQLNSTDTVIDEAAHEQLEIDLETGDEVLLLTEDDQIFYILMKVVKAV